MMKNSDDAIAKVLAGLRDAEAPSGMEGRILKSAQDRALEDPSFGQRWLRLIWPGIQSSFSARLLFVGAALACILIVTVPLLRRSSRIEKPPAQSNLTSPDTRPTFSTADMIANSAPAPPRPPSAQRPAHKSQRKIMLNRSDDSPAWREMQAASLPAPPLPLTEEERLLVRVARAGHPEPLAVLNGDVRARLQEKSKLEFEQFFGESPAKHDNKQN